MMVNVKFWDIQFIQYNIFIYLQLSHLSGMFYSQPLVVTALHVTLASSCNAELVLRLTQRVVREHFPYMWGGQLGAWGQSMYAQWMTMKQCANVFIGLWVLRGACPLRWGSSQHVRSDLPWAFSPLKRSQCDMSFEDLPLDGQFLFFLPRSKVNH